MLSQTAILGIAATMGGFVARSPEIWRGAWGYCQTWRSGRDAKESLKIKNQGDLNLAKEQGKISQDATLAGIAKQQADNNSLLLANLLSRFDQQHDDISQLNQEHAEMQRRVKCLEIIADKYAVQVKAMKLAIKHYMKKSGCAEGEIAAELAKYPDVVTHE